MAKFPISQGVRELLWLQDAEFCENCMDPAPSPQLGIWMVQGEGLDFPSLLHAQFPHETLNDTLERLLCIDAHGVQ